MVPGWRPETEWGIALEREAVIRPLAEQARLSTAAIEDAVARLRLSRSVLYVRRFAERQLPSPHYRTIQGALRDWICTWSSQSAKDRNVRGIYAAPSAFSLFAPISPWTVQIDHTLRDVVVVDREQRLPIGRPWLSLAIDVASRAIAGFSVALESPSALSLSVVLSHTVLSKACWLADRSRFNCRK